MKIHKRDSGFECTDRKQTWKRTTNIRAGHDWGAINTTAIETLDFDACTIEYRYFGTHEGDRVNERSVNTTMLTPEHDPAKCAEYRRRNGYVRIR